MSKAEVVASILLLGATLYAVFGGADFGAGIWELFARRSADPEAVRTRIQHSIAPVWEANHVWLIFILVFFWTGFPEAFAAVMSTLYIPLALAAVGIVLRGSGFAFGKVIDGPWRRKANAVFALSSVITPFFMGAVVGAIVAGEVQVNAKGDVFGDPLESWIGFFPISVGLLFVTTGAYLAAVFLVHDASSAGEEDNARLFGRWALVAAAFAGGLAILAAVALYDVGDEFFKAHAWSGLTGDALPLAFGSFLCGAAALVAIAGVARRGGPLPWFVRPLSVAAVFLLVVAGGVALHPYLLPPGFGPGGGTSLLIKTAAAPDPTLNALLIVFALALVIVVPALLLLYSLSQKRLLE